jgi:pimeloyl-ACP methyl ester carboxylesterase
MFGDFSDFLKAHLYENSITIMKTIILVHGAFQGSYSWNVLSGMLKDIGYHVIAPELPGHGRNTADLEQVRFHDYTKAITDVLDKTAGKAVLIGHSMGGLVISAVAEQLPNKVERLIYVAGLIPYHGSSLIEIGVRDVNSVWGEIVEPSENPHEVRIKKEYIIPVLCQNIHPDMEQLVLNNYHPEPAVPFTEPVLVSDECWGQIQKHYVFCSQDKSVSYAQQKDMVNKAGIISTNTLDSDHTPQLSMPKALLNIILQIL